MMVGVEGFWTVDVVWFAVFCLVMSVVCWVGVAADVKNKRSLKNR